MSSINTPRRVGIECIVTENSKSRDGDVKKSPFLVHVDLFQQQKKGDDGQKKKETCTEPEKVMTS